MVALAHAVVDPGAVVVHLADAALADGAVVRAVGLDAAALGALEDHLALLEAHPLDVLFSRVAPGYRALEEEKKDNLINFT